MSERSPEELIAALREEIPEAEAKAAGAWEPVAEMIAELNEQLPVREIATAIGKSKSWTGYLLKWHKAEHAYPSPFHPPRKPRKAKCPSDGQEAVADQTEASVVRLADGSVIDVGDLGEAAQAQVNVHGSALADGSSTEIDDFEITPEIKAALRDYRDAVRADANVGSALERLHVALGLGERSLAEQLEVERHLAEYDEAARVALTEIDDAEFIDQTDDQTDVAPAESATDIPPKPDDQTDDVPEITDAPEIAEPPADVHTHGPGDVPEFLCRRCHPELGQTPKSAERPEYRKSEAEIEATLAAEAV